MDASTLFRDLFEVLIVVAIGGMLFTVVRRLRRGQIRVIRCPECERPTSRAYPVCKWCGAPRPADG
jgi:hypothetical protein